MKNIILNKKSTFFALLAITTISLSAIDLEIDLEKALTKSPVNAETVAVALAPLFENMFPIGILGMKGYLGNDSDMRAWNNAVSTMITYVSSNNAFPSSAKLTNAARKSFEVNENLIKIIRDMMANNSQASRAQHTEYLLEERRHLQAAIDPMNKESLMLQAKKNARAVVNVLSLDLLMVIQNALKLLGYTPQLAKEDYIKLIAAVQIRAFTDKNLFQVPMDEDGENAWNRLVREIGEYVADKNKPVNKSLEQAMSACVTASGNLIDSIKTFKNVPNKVQGRSSYVGKLQADKQALEEAIGSIKGGNKDAQELVTVLGKTLIATIDKALGDIKKI